MADDCSNPSDSDSPDALPGDDDQNGRVDENIGDVNQGQWQGEIQRVQGLQGELRRLSTVRFVDLERRS